MVSFKNLKLKRRIVYKYRELLSKKFSRESVFTLLSFMFELTPTGFETYIAEYLRKIVQFEMTNVTGWYKDKWVDIRAQNDWYVYAIQCKKYWASHVKQRDILDFVQNTKDLRVKYGNKIRFYFVTTSRVNRYAQRIADQNWIIIRWYKDILHMNTKFPINDFIKRNKWDSVILEGVDTEDVLDVFYFRKAVGRWWLADAVYFILKHTLSRFSDYRLDYQKVDKEISTNKSLEYSFLEKESPIKKEDTFVGEVK